MIRDIVFYFVDIPELKTSALNYFQYILRCAVKHNPDNNVWFIGNNNPNIEGVKFIYIPLLGNRLSKEFDFYYIPLYNPNEPNYVYQSIVRWFYLLELVKQKKIKSVLSLDSDVTLLTDVSKISQLHPVHSHIGYDFFKTDKICCDEMCPHVAFINDVSLLERFCKFCIELYKDRSSKLYTLADEMKRTKSSFGVSDMELWGLFINENRDKFACHTSDEGMFDVDVSQSEGLLMKNGLKLIFKDEKEYYGLRNNEKVYINSLHWNGDNKEYIQEFYNRYL